MHRILIVEDNEMNRDVLSRRLRKRGFDVTLAVDGRAGIEQTKATKPDLVLMDLSLPEVDGLTATRELKGNPETAGIPIVVLTAHAMVSDREQAMAAGSDDFATKPIEFEKLLAKMYALLPELVKV